MSIAPAHRTNDPLRASGVNVEAADEGDGLVDDHELAVVAPIYRKRRAPRPCAAPFEMNACRAHVRNIRTRERAPGSHVIRAQPDGDAACDALAQRVHERIAHGVRRQDVALETDVPGRTRDLLEHGSVEQVTFDKNLGRRIVRPRATKGSLADDPRIHFAQPRDLAAGKQTRKDAIKCARQAIGESRRTKRDRAGENRESSRSASD